MGNSVGIDLGTTNSVAAFKFDQLSIVTGDGNSPEDRHLTRSMVAWQNNQIIVGQEAYNQIKSEPENVIISIKRLMGRGFGDAVVQQQLSRFSYKITQSSSGTENSLCVSLGGKENSPEDISAFILTQVLKNAQTYQQANLSQTQQITQAVITVPAYFNDKQRYATQQAAYKAGIKNVELLPEPTAAAISYGYSPTGDEVKTLLVYDFGGGTFDCSVVTASGNQFIETAKAGDLWLGGDDIDQLIVNYVKNTVAQEEGIDDIDALINKMPYYQKVKFLGELKFAAEKAKIALSTNLSTEIILSTPLLDELGMAMPISATLTREQFEVMILPLVERSITVCQEAIKYSEYPLEMIDKVLLVGGSSQIPLVALKAKEAFGADKVVVHPRPMYAVAEGAAIAAAGLVEKVGSVSRDYFIELADEPRFKLIKQGDILPVKTTHTFRTQADGQSLIHFKFYSPDSVSESLDHRKRDERLGDIWLALEKDYKKGTEVLVTLELDEKDSPLKITAALKNDPNIKVSSSFSRGGEDEKISKEVEEIIKELNEAQNLTEVGAKKAYVIAGEVVQAANQAKGDDGILKKDRLQAAQKKLQELKTFASDDHHAAKMFISEFQFALETCPFLIPDPQQKRINTLISDLETALAANNYSALQKLSEDAALEYKNLPDEVKMILTARYAISQAHSTNPTDANAMSSKLGQMINALKYGDVAEANRLWRSLGPDIERYLSKETKTGTIATGLTR